MAKKKKGSRKKASRSSGDRPKVRMEKGFTVSGLAKALAKNRKKSEERK